MLSSAAADAETQLRRARAILEAELRAGRDRRAESLLAEYPAVAADPEVALELVYTEFAVREGLGQRPDPADWFARFPQWREQLEGVFEVHAEVCKSEAGRPSPAEAKALASPPVRKPTRVAGFEVVRELGRGGMGVVYEARQVALNRTVAVKVILSGSHAGDRERERFRREAESAARLDHPNIVRVYEVGEDNGRPYCAMEYVDGGSLADRLTGEPWAAKTAAECVAVLARAAGHAHARDVAHRDLKPANVLLTTARTAGSDESNPLTSFSTDPGSPPVTPKLADFGLAKCLADTDRGPTRTGDVLGTPAYMSPEQAEGRAHLVGAATDVWALGAVFYELLTGHPPFRGGSAVETLQQVRTAEPVPPRRLRPQLPRDLETICLTCLLKPPMARYLSAAALADDLGRWLRGEPILARPVGWVGRAARWCRRNPRVAALSGAVLVLSLAAAGTGAAAVGNLAVAEREANRAAGTERAARTIEEVAAAAARQRTVQLLVADGARRLEDGDTAAAAVVFAAAFAADTDPSTEEAHRVRIGTALRASPTLRRLARPEVHDRAQLRLSADGSTLLVRNPDRGPAVWPVLDDGPARLELPNGSVGWNDVARLSSDGSTLVAALPTGAKAWDVKTGKPVGLPLPAGASPFPPPFSRDGGRHLTLDMKTARVFDDTGAAVGAAITDPARLSAAALSADGKRVVTGGWDGTVRVWDAGTGKEVCPPLALGDMTRAVAFSPDGARAAAASRNGTAQVFDPATGRAAGHRLTHPGGTVGEVVFSPDGKLVLTADSTGTWRAWAADTGLPVGEPMPAGQGGAAEFGADGRSVVLSTRAGLVRGWDAAAGRAGTPPLHLPTASTAARPFVPARLACGDRHLVSVDALGTVRAWDLPAPGVGPENGVVGSAAWTPDGRSVVTVGAVSATRWDPTDGRVVWEVKYPEAYVRTPGTVALTPDGRRLLVSSRGRPGIGVWDARTGQPAGPPLPVAVGTLVLCCPPGERCLTVDAGGRLRLWHLPTAAPVGAPSAPGARGMTTEATPDGRRVLVGAPPVFRQPLGAGPTPPRLWDPAGDKLVADLPVPWHREALALTPDGRAALVLTPDGLLRQFDPATGGPAGPEVRTGEWTDHLASSPDGKRVALARRSDHSVQVWELKTGERVGPAVPHPAAPFKAVFSPDGRTLASGAADGAARVWDVATGRPVAPPVRHARATFALAFSPDGRKLVIAPTGARSRVLDLSPDPRPPEELAARAQLLANRRLDDHGQLVALTREQEQELWARLRPGR